MYYPHADDEIVAMGYANYNQAEENETMVIIREDAFRSYIFANYIDHLDKETLLDLLQENLGQDRLMEMAQNAFDLPFTHEENKIILIDANELLLKHSEPVFADCDDCDTDDDDYDIITSDDDDWDDEEFAPYDDLDDTADEEVQ